MLKALAIFSFYHSFSRRTPISFTHHPWGNSADRCARSGRWIFFSSHTLEKPSIAKSKRRLSQLLQTANDSPGGSWLDLRPLALLWCLAQQAGQDLAWNSADSEGFSFGLEPPFSPEWRLVLSQRSISPHQIPSTTTGRK